MSISNVYKFVALLLFLTANNVADAALVTLIGTELGLETHAQATPTSELFITSFPATATVSDTLVEFPDVESLFDPSTGVPPGFAGSLVNVAIDAGADFLEIDFTNSAPFFRFATGFQNTYVFSFESAVALQITEAIIDTNVTTLGLTADRVTFDGNRLFVNVQSLPFNTSTFARINLTAASVPDLSPVPEPSTLVVFGIGACIAGIGAFFRRRREQQREAVISSRGLSRS